jgi:hypothetical protein
MNMMIEFRIGLSALIWLAAAGIAQGENVVFPEDAAVVDVTRAPYSAKGDGQTDDTLAIQRALDDHPSGNAIIYLRNGTYLVSDTLRWPAGAHGGVWMKRTILQGQSQEGTVIRLTDDAAAYQNPAETKAVLYTGGPPAQRFRNSIRNLTVDTGAGNPGATGVQYMANNQGAVHHLTVRSSDPENAGVIGLDLGYANEQGPCLIREVTIQGFDLGIRTRHSVDSVTMEFIRVRDQRQLGVLNDGQVLSVRGFKSQNAVPAMKNTGSHSVLTLIDAQLDGPTNAPSRGAAILNEKDAMLFARNVKTHGYAAAIQSDTPRGTDERQVAEYASHAPHSLFGAPGQRSLDLPVRETPDVPWGDVRKDWISPLALGGKADGKTDNTGALQRALDAGRKTVYLPNGNWRFEGVVRVPAGVQRILGCEAKLTGKGTLVILPGSGPLRLERLDLIYSQVKIDHRSPRTLAISSVTLGGGGYLSANGSGDLFLEDVCGGPWRFERQNVWARQLNPETQETKIVNEAGQLWILGLKTEKGGTLVENRAGASTEVLGCFAYANTADEKPPMFINHRSDLSFTMGESVLRRQPFRQVVKETRRDETRVLSMEDVPDRGGGSRLALYVGRASGVRIVRNMEYQPEQWLAGPDHGDDHRVWLAE